MTTPQAAERRLSRQRFATGRLDAGVDLAAGQDAVHGCALDAFAQRRDAAGRSLNAVERLIKITVRVASAAR